MIPDASSAQVHSLRLAPHLVGRIDDRGPRRDEVLVRDRRADAGSPLDQDGVTHGDQLVPGRGGQAASLGRGDRVVAGEVEFRQGRNGRARRRRLGGRAALALGAASCLVAAAGGTLAAWRGTRRAAGHRRATVSS